MAEAQIKTIDADEVLAALKEGKTVTLTTAGQKRGYHKMEVTAKMTDRNTLLVESVKFLKKDGTSESVKNCHAEINNGKIEIFQDTKCLGRYDPSTKNFTATLNEIIPAKVEPSEVKPSEVPKRPEAAAPAMETAGQKTDIENKIAAVKNKITEEAKKIGDSIALEYRDLRRKESVEGGFTDKEQRRLSELWGLLNNDFSLSDAGMHYVKNQLKTDYDMLAGLEKQSAQITETTARPAPAPAITEARKKEYNIEHKLYGHMIGIKITGSGAEIIMENALKGRDMEEAKAAALKQMQNDSHLLIHRGLPTGFDLATIDMKNYEIILDPESKYIEIMPKSTRSA